MNSLFLLLASVASFPLLGAETINEVETNAFAGYTQEFLLPVDVTSSPKQQLSVSIPKGFKSLQPLDYFTQAANIMIEYIPEGDHENSWSEIITLNKFVGKKVPVIPFTDTLKMQLMAETRNSKILENATSRDEGAQAANFIMRYLLDGKQEVIGVQYFSGPFDAAGVQYTIRLNDKMSEEDAVKKIKEFFASNVSLIKV